MIGFYSAGAMLESETPVDQAYGVTSFSTTTGEAFGAPQRFGWVFRPNQNITLIGMRCIYQGLIGTESGEDLRLFRVSDSSLIANTTALPLVPDQWREGTVSSVVLLSGVDYMVTGEPSNMQSRAFVRNNEVSYSPYITASTGSFFGSGPDIPTNASFSSYRFIDIVFEV